jgi:S-adenosylhomocysteine hydrolase
VHAVVAAVNRLQAIFTATAVTAEFPIPIARRAQQPTIEVIAEIARQQQSGVSMLSDLRHVLLTSRRIEGMNSTGVHRDDRLNIVSDHSETLGPEATILWCARRLLQIGVAAVIRRTCPRSTCVAGSNQEYAALCNECEDLLKGAGYRDGIHHLKESINWLNQNFQNTTPNIDSAPSAEIPATLRLAQEYAENYLGGSTPFTGKTVLMVLHFLSDIIPFVHALHYLGADYESMVLIAKPYPYSHRDAVSHRLECLGVQVYRAGKREVSAIAADILEKLRRSPRLGERTIIVIEDGGYFAPLLHEERFEAVALRCIGVVEQTTKGIREAEDRIKRFKLPILSVAESKFKGDYESPEIGRLTVQNVGRFVPNVKLSGGHAIVFGFGSIGEHVAANLNRAFNMGVSVVVNNPAHLLKAIHRKDIVMEAKATFDELRFSDIAVLVIGTTGRESTISKSILSRLKDGCILASTSSDRIEIDMTALEAMAGANVDVIEEGNVRYIFDFDGRRKAITVLADGYPINFFVSESLPNDTIDPVMTLLLLCAVEICKGVVPLGIQRSLVDRITDDHRLIEHILERL